MNISQLLLKSISELISFFSSIYYELFVLFDFHISNSNKLKWAQKIDLLVSVKKTFCFRNAFFILRKTSWCQQNSLFVTIKTILVTIKTILVAIKTIFVTIKAIFVTIKSFSLTIKSFSVTVNSLFVTIRTFLST